MLARVAASRVRLLQLRTPLHSSSRRSLTTNMSLPAQVTAFWSKRDQAFLDNIDKDYADEFTLTFVGPHTPPFMTPDKMTMTKDKLPMAMGNLMQAFPDLEFKAVEEIKEVEPGKFQALTAVSGTHTGGAFSPAPHLEAIPATGKAVTIGPETFTVYMKDGKVTAVTVECLHAGKPVGPPGFYTEIGGVMKPPPAA
ncbi:SnoaL-like domain-containing protein [Pseudoscourfieldia marina]|mmetsp:Transcript_10615/g.26915  ORF Transcript_10615/g.26915 Transcript_10615/m.26915 type:complete len:196 (-) Transcript_10615:90-677(-)